ncbi:MAG TPA: multicopper oxidase family protein [Ktedonobacteraceae bacterium]|jgi:FtsP/CotA-like multicopper oxidase with cupredoxin domain|nr:multicopper oxidase family protein [Ktedonobacteraceae bacterium]
MDRKDRVQSDAISRRTFIGMVAGAGSGAVLLDGCGSLPPIRTIRSLLPHTPSTAATRTYILAPTPAKLTLGKQTVSTWVYNGGMLPGPTIRVNVGNTLRAIVHNHLNEGTTIHWHGLPVLNAMDGVDTLTQPPIPPGQSFTYEFVVPTAGTYWYHPHAGLQLDRGLYGALIVDDPGEQKNYDQDVVLMLDDWLDGVPGGPGNPSAELKQLSAGGDHMLGMNMDNQLIASVQMPPDVIYPYYLVNGKTANDPFTISVQKGQRIRLRFINASAATIYHLAINGHRMSVTHTDGQAVVPVEVDTLRIGMGERYDVLVTANNPGVWQLAAQVEGVRRMARAILRYQGSTAALPPADFLPPELNQRLLTYAMLNAAPGIFTPAIGQPDHTVSFLLSGGITAYAWQINNQLSAKATQITVPRDHRISFQLNNQSMMPHPIHLHGHFFQLDNGSARGPLKDTVIVDPMQQVNITWISNNPGLWAFHCQNLYHQATGMMNVIKIG